MHVVWSFNGSQRTIQNQHFPVIGGLEDQDVLELGPVVIKDLFHF